MNSYLQARYEKDFLQTLMDMREWLKLGERIGLAVDKRLQQLESLVTKDDKNS